MADVNEKILRQWVIGLYAESVGLSMTDEKLDLIKLQSAVKFADEIMAFLKEHNLLKC